MILRDYQQDIVDQILVSELHDLVQLDTGGGKTAIIATIAAQQPTICIAHRNMLVEQISETLVKVGVSHSIIATAAIQKRCQLIMRKADLAQSNQCYAASLQSMLSWHKLGKLALDTALPYRIIIDEAHHVAEDNMWHSLSEIFPNAHFLGFTATPCRLDGRSLHSKNGGLFDRLIQAESLKKNSTAALIARNYLSDYIAYCPPTTIDFSELKIGASGEYTAQSVVDAVSKKRIVGEVVESYQKHANGLKALVFCPNIANAKHISENLKYIGLSASYIASSLSLAENNRRLDAFRRDEIRVLVNVAMATEGFDLPEVECLIDLCPNASFGLVRQKWGRVLRPKKDGQKAIIIDHAANVLKHGLPDDPVIWNIEGNPAQEKSELINCEECHHVYDCYLTACPNCGHKSWLRAESSGQSQMIKAEIIPAELVKKVREKWRQDDLEQAKRDAAEAYQIKLQTTPMPPDFRYGGDAVGKMCQRISLWIYENIKDSMTAVDVNRFTQADAPDTSFYMQQFSVRDLSSKNPDKCKKAVEQWLSR